MDWILILSVAALCTGLGLYGRYWRRRCGQAFFRHAVACGEREDREKLMRYAVTAGNRQALVLYALTYPELFDKARPLRPFGFNGIRCVFVGYYFPQRYEYWLCDSQTDFVQRVYDFKSGKDDCRDCFSQAFDVLAVDGDVTAVFMPCSTPERYYRRFAGIASFLEAEGYARSGLELVWMTRERESKHLSGRRSDVDTANYVMSGTLKGRCVVIVDDLLTSGDSLMGYARNLERAGAIVVGAVFLARTFQIPPLSRVRWRVWKRHVSALLSGK